MSSRYSIIQYVPNPIADERINIGVVAFDENKVRVYFLHHWTRVRDFGGKNISFLQDFAKRMEKSVESGLLFPGDQENGLSKYERLEKVAQGWMNSIQFTESRGSLKNIDKTFEDAIKKFLVEPSNQQAKIRDRDDAAKITVLGVEKALVKFLKDRADSFSRPGNQTDSLLRKKYKIVGKQDTHQFDVAIANGKPYLAAYGVSFEVKPRQPNLKALSWSISDVKEKEPDLPLAVVVLPPKKTSENYQENESNYQKTIATYSNLGAEVIQEYEIGNWIDTQLKSNLISNIIY